MRDIKFRAWATYDHKMYNVKELQWSATNKNELRKIIVFTGVHETNRALMIPYHKVELMQYTGLLDKNGKEICEGDILQPVHASHVDYPDKEYSRPSKRMVVEWRCNYNRNGWNVSNQAKVSEIIGNIYENPDLLANNK